jgi:hypothetical protein
VKLRATPAIVKSDQLPTRSNPSRYVTATQTKALLTSSLAARIERLKAGDMVTTREAAELFSTPQATVDAWIAKGRAIGLTQARHGCRMPKWQFEPQVWAVMEELFQSLGTTDGWTMLSFLESSLGGLNGQPNSAIRRCR